MDIHQELITKHSRASRDRIVAYVGSNSGRFALLFDLFRNGDPGVAQRAAWSMSNCAESYPELVAPYLKEMVSYLQQVPIHDSIKRNILRVLQEMEIVEELEGELLSTCFNFLMNKQEAVAIRTFAMQVLANFSRKYPEIRNELRVIIEDELPYARPAFVSRGRKILRSFKKIEAVSYLTDKKY